MESNITSLASDTTGMDSSFPGKLRPSRNVLTLLVLVALSVATMIRFDRPLIRGDGVAYLAWLDTFALDHDINFDNQLQRLQPVNTYQISWNEETQRYVNIFPFGVAILQAPFYLVGHFFLLNNWWNINPDYFYQMQGVGLPYSLWVMVGANLMALAAIVLAWLIGRRLTGSGTAAVASWAVFLGTPLFYYSTVSPLNSHNAGAMATTCLIYLLVDSTGLFRDREMVAPTALFKSLLLGVSAGMMILVRWQLLMVVLPAFGLLAWKGQWRTMIYGLVVAAIIALPLPIIWQQMFGRPIVVPYEAVQGQSFLQVPTGAFWVLRQTPRNSPVLYLSLIGLFFLWRVDRHWLAFVLVVIVAQVLVNGAVLDWWGGETYGVRRMTELYPIYVLLACAALGNLPQRKWSTVWLVFTRVALMALIAYTFLYILSFFSYTWTNTDNLFIAGPETMIRHFLGQANRWQIMSEIIRTHLGPPAWSMPGP